MPNINNHLPLTPDLNAERLQTLKKLFPDLFTIEGKLNPDELKKIIDPDLVKETERFEFKWFGKSNAKRTAFTPSKATLIYDKERSVNPDESDGNMIIEGENLETLKCLLSGYRNRIKCIYIDPPYNTGKDFVYSDKWNSDRETYWEHIGVTENGVKLDSNSDASGRYHSNWLNMMYSRLLLARQLLRDDGVIFISIDDNEVHHLRKLCDEVFGPDNFVANFLWKKKGTTSNVEGAQVSSLVDNTLCFRKSENGIIKSRVKLKETRSYPDEDKEGNYRLTVIEKKDSGSYKRDSMKFEILGHKPRKGKRWQIGIDTAKELEEKNRFIYDGEKIKLKIYDFEDKDTLSAQPNLLFEHGSTDSASDDIKELFSVEELFDNPKPKELIEALIEFVCNKNDIILDFFAGSGTTAHAVMDLNKEDSGNRKFILVQLPELTDENSEAYKAGYKKISDITIERNKRVIERIQKEEKEKDPELFDKDKKPYRPGFKVYRLDKSNFPRVDFVPQLGKSDEENVDLLKRYIIDKEDMFLSDTDDGRIFDEVLLKNGFMLNYKKEHVEDLTENKVYRINDTNKECLICMDMSVDEKTIAGLESYKDSVFICLERALDTTTKWNLKHLFGEKLVAF